MGTFYGNRPCVDPRALLKECEDRDLPTATWFGKANTFEVKLGQVPGSGFILLRLADLDALDLTVDHTLKLQDDAGSPPQTFQRIAFLGAACVTPGYEDDGQAVFVCGVADRRWHLDRIPIPDGGKSYNVPSGDDYLSASLNAGTPWTWTTLLQNLWTTLGLGSLPTLPFTPNGTPENFVFFGEEAWAWLAVNHVVTRIGCAIRYNPTTDVFDFVRLGDTGSSIWSRATAAMRHLRGKRTWEEYRVEPDRTGLPEKVRVLFPRTPQPTDGSPIHYAVDVTLTATEGVEAGSVVQLIDDLAARGATGTPTNSAALTSRATERANDWRRKRVEFDRGLGVVYRDFQSSAVASILGGVASVAFDDRGGAMRTEARAGRDSGLETWRPREQPWLGQSGCECGRGLIAGATKDDCWELTVTCARGNMESLNTSQTLTLAWDDDNNNWVSTSDFYIGEYATRVRLSRGTNGEPRLFLVDPAYYLTFACEDVASQTLKFSGGNSGETILICAKETNAGPANNLFTVEVKWVRCANEMYTGAGWYTIIDCDGDTVCVELTEDPGPVEILDGPHETEEACNAGISTSCAENMPRLMKIRYFNHSDPGDEVYYPPDTDFTLLSNCPSGGFFWEACNLTTFQDESTPGCDDGRLVSSPPGCGICCTYWVRFGCPTGGAATGDLELQFSTAFPGEPTATVSVDEGPPFIVTGTITTDSGTVDYEITEA